MAVEKTSEPDNSNQGNESQQGDQQAAGQVSEQQVSEEGLTTTQVIEQREAQRAAGKAEGEGDPKPDNGKPAEKSEGEGDAEGESEGSEETGAPETYGDFETPDNGVGLTGSMIDGICEVAKDLDLSKEKAQKLVSAVAVSQRNQMVELRTEWQTAALKDPEIGGSKHKEALGYAKAAMTKFGSDEFNALLGDTSAGIGDMPEVIRFLSRVGKSISDDKLHTGAPQQARRSESKSSDAAVLFDKSLS